MTTLEKKGWLSRFLDKLSPKYEVRIFPTDPDNIRVRRIFAGDEGHVDYFYFEWSAKQNCSLLNQSRRMIGYSEWEYRVVKLR